MIKWWEVWEVLTVAHSTASHIKICIIPCKRIREVSITDVCERECICFWGCRCIPTYIFPIALLKCLFFFFLVNLCGSHFLYDQWQQQFTCLCIDLAIVPNQNTCNWNLTFQHGITRYLGFLKSYMTFFMDYLWCQMCNCFWITVRRFAKCRFTRQSSFI